MKTKRDTDSGECLCDMKTEIQTAGSVECLCEYRDTDSGECLCEVKTDTNSGECLCGDGDTDSGECVT